MDKREEIPRWAIAEAKVIAEEVDYATYEHSVLTIARALSKARSQAYEECAKIAIKQAPATQDWNDAPLQDLAKRIAQAIRQHSQKGGEE